MGGISHSREGRFGLVLCRVWGTSQGLVKGEGGDQQIPRVCKHNLCTVVGHVRACGLVYYDFVVRTKSGGG